MTSKIWKVGKTCWRTTVVDLVVISTPTESHYSLTKSALYAQKHVLCEKPFTHTAKEADELIAIASEQQRVLAVFHNRRWDSDFVNLSQLVKSGALGQVTNFDTRFEIFPPKLMSDKSMTVNKATLQIKAIYDLGTHLLDQAVQIFGLPERVTGLLGTETEDANFSHIFTVKMHYHNVRGDKGSFRKLYVDIQQDHLMAGKSPIDEGFGEEPEERYGVLATKQGDGSVVEKIIIPVQHPTWAEYYRKLAAAMSGQGPVPVSGSEARDVIRVIELAVSSSQLAESIDFSS
ncbi:hypothetical protein N7493_005517 [Penicillium malachiteum]|uniref:Oxidoreductase n=1 Tax=Penicillium malachiteum TaxID=1324776 RepID=A0AAD6HMT4_9EURO|nr:hypothetical protein N7493_005517 [Penicillium malachiteum]